MLGGEAPWKQLRETASDKENLKLNHVMWDEVIIVSDHSSRCVGAM